LKIAHLDLKKGIAKVIPESLDDLWHLYNIILEKDEVHAKTTRTVKTEEYLARPQKGKRFSVFLGLKIKKTDWNKFLNRLRIHGVVCKAPEDLNIKGSHHTIDITINKPISILKTKWLKHEINRLKKASNITTPPIIVISIDDEEYCVTVLRQYGVDVTAREKTRLPGKLEAEKRSGALRNFFKEAYSALREAWLRLQSPIVIIGPGFVKKQFFQYVQSTGFNVADAVVDIKSVNNAGIAGVHEALRSGVLTKALKEVRVAQETKIVEEALARLGKGGKYITYGLSEVEKASGYGAVETLLVADLVLRTLDERRKLLEKIMRDVDTKRGKTTIISTEHEAGKALLSLGGVAALLRFPLA